MLATKKQITYLQHLADRAQFIKMRHPSLIPQGLMHQVWGIDMTSEKASARIDYYNAILRQCDLVLYPHKKVAEIETQPTQAVPPPNYVQHREADIWELAGLF